MHLLDTSTYTLHESQGSAIPDYAILSHRWDSEEVSFHDIKSRRGYNMAGFAKIKGCCAQAASEGWQYVWIDSCCIDKSSSAELSEAINSMFRWYRDAQVCYAHLSDVPGGDQDPSEPGSAFRNSKWFTRGWTLQELLAPSTVVFYNRDWIEIGTKSSLYAVLTSITKIKLLSNYEEASVAQKMSWASERETTREEDMAYCLMGLFGVNMPPLYGEAGNAFRRLQLEILNKSDDESIFAWKDEEQRESGLLARSPAAFRESGDIRLVDGMDRPPFAMTNKGLRIELLVMQRSDFSVLDSRFDMIAPINCAQKGTTRLCALALKKGNGNTWSRSSGELIEWHKTPLTVKQEMKPIYIPQPEYVLESQGISNRRREFRFLVKTGPILAKGFQIVQQEVSQDISGTWESTALGLSLTTEVFGLGVLPFISFRNYAALFFVNDESKDRFVLTLNIDRDYNIGVDIINPVGQMPLKTVLESFCGRRRPLGGRSLRQDRASKPLRWGLTVSAALRKELVDGKKVYVVDVMSKSGK